MKSPIFKGVNWLFMGRIRLGKFSKLGSKCKVSGAKIKIRKFRFEPNWEFRELGAYF